MTLLPRAPIDLLLAPVAVHLDMKLARLRDMSPAEISYAMALELDRPERTGTAAERAERLLAATVRNVELTQILPALKPPKGSAGKVGGHARFAATGNSFRLKSGRLLSCWPIICCPAAFLITGCTTKSRSPRHPGSRCGTSRCFPPACGLRSRRWVPIRRRFPLSGLRSRFT